MAGLTPAQEKKIYGDCITNIVAASNGAITNQEAKLLLKDLNTVIKLVKMNNPANAPLQGAIHAQLANALGLIKQGKKQAAFIGARDREVTKTKVDLYQNKGTAKEMARYLYGNLLGTYSEINGGKDSTDVNMTTACNMSLSRLEQMLDEQKVLEHFTKGIDEDKVVSELSQLTDPQGKPGITGNKDALKVAQIVHNWRAQDLAEAARVGIFVPELQGYTSRQTHDPNIIRHTGFDQWFKDILPRLDQFKTFGMINPSLSNWEEFMLEKYLNIISGRHLDYDSYDDKYVPPGTNMAQKFAAQRTIHFKSAKDAYEYSNQYGIRSFREQLISSAVNLARATALVKEWGSRPEVTMRKMVELIKDKSREEGDVETIRDMEGSRISKVTLLGKPDNLIAEILGQTRTPAQKNFWYTFNQWAVALRSTAALGMATISAQTDLVNLAGQLATIEGSNPLMNYVRIASKYYLPHSADVPKISRQCGILAQALRAQLVNERWGAMDASGKASKLSALFFKLNLLHFHDQRITNIGAALMANHFGDLAEKSWLQLPKDTQIWMQRFGIKEDEWNAIREHSFKGGDGNNYLTPVSVDGITSSRLMSMNLAKSKNIASLANDPEAIRDDLRIKFANMFTDAAGNTVPRAGARERMILYRGTSPGTPEGTALRLMFLFKTFPLAMMTKILNRDIYGQSRGRMNMVMSMAMKFAIYTVCGAGIYCLKQYLSGKSPPDTSTVKGAKTMMARSVTSGGGLGYAGDIVLPEDDKEGLTSTLLKGMGGPIGSDVGDTLDILGHGVKDMTADEKTRKKDRIAAEKKGVDLVSHYTPFANHFATKFLLNYYARYAILDMIDPDYTYRMNKNMQKNDGSHFLVSPAVNAKDYKQTSTP